MKFTEIWRDDAGYYFLNAVIVTENHLLLDTGLSVCHFRLAQKRCIVLAMVRPYYSTLIGNPTQEVESTAQRGR